MELVGKDSLGNKYYYILKPGMTTSPKRIYQNDNPDPGNIPPAWQAWLTGTRSDPPHDHEVDFQAFKPENSEESFAPNKGLNHASAPSAGANVKFKEKSEPESKGDTFQPGSWSPR
jgi:NADH:ubiquinone oxidoreductase subunit